MPQVHPSEVAHVVDVTHRRDWRARRTAMEMGGVLTSRLGTRAPPRLTVGPVFERFAGAALRASALYGRGVRNALAIRLSRHEVTFGDLPQAFDGYRILQISDVHADFLPDVVSRAIALIGPLEVDLCVVTGDLRRHDHGPHAHVLPAVESLLAAAAPRDGAMGILGNHDPAAIVDDLEARGVRMLLNERATVHRGGESIEVVGTDDPYAYYTAAAASVLRVPADRFRVALVHTVDLADFAVAGGARLYLAGHTHGGQVCLPGGRPIVTRQHCHRHLSVGRWRFGAMEGHTSTGLGVSGLPVRFNCPGEVALLTLRRGQRGGGNPVRADGSARR